MTTDFSQIYQIYEPYKRTISKESIMTIVGNLHIWWLLPRISKYSYRFDVALVNLVRL